MFQSVDAIVPISNADATQISISSKLPIHTAIAGVDVKAYVKIHTSEFEPFSIFHFGSMDWIPNQEAVDWFLKFCWPEIRTEIPQVKFIIGGRNIPKRFKQLSSDQVIIRENVQNAAAIFSKYNIMIVPVLSGSGMRVKIVEGLSYGKAIVSTTLGAEGIEIENNKHISIVDSPLDFSKQVINLLKNEAERIRMERNAREYAIENLDYLSISEKLIYFYKKLID
jgi:glycosyltransferase involved in cell wall biosynthesis